MFIIWLLVSLYSSKWSKKIEIFIKNETDETLQVIVRGIAYNFEIDRVPKNKTRKIKVPESETIYIIGGNTQKEYEEIFCNSPDIEYVIRKRF
jgi:hypothetical protein